MVPGKRIFDPSALLDREEAPEQVPADVFVRHSKEAKVKKLLELKRKKEKREEKRKIKSQLKKSKTPTQYVGMGQSASTLVNLKKTRKFTSPQKIGGKRMVLKDNGQVVHLETKVVKQPLPTAPPYSMSGVVPEVPENTTSKATQAELDFMDRLLRTAEEAIGSDLFNDNDINMVQQTSTAATTNNVTQMPEFDPTQERPVVMDDFPSLGLGFDFM
jgi:hypothetical protein